VADGVIMQMDAWLSLRAERLAAATGLSRHRLELTAADIDHLLEAARVAAHESGDRRNAPLICYLIGVAAASGKSVAELAPHVE
jgi:hypothetical protein